MHLMHVGSQLNASFLPVQFVEKYKVVACKQKRSLLQDLWEHSNRCCSNQFNICSGCLLPSLLNLSLESHKVCCDFLGRLLGTPSALNKGMANLVCTKLNQCGFMHVLIKLNVCVRIFRIIRTELLVCILRQCNLKDTHEHRDGLE